MSEALQVSETLRAAIAAVGEKTLALQRAKDEHRRLDTLAVAAQQAVITADNDLKAAEGRLVLLAKSYKAGGVVSAAPASQPTPQAPHVPNPLAESGRSVRRR